MSSIIYRLRLLAFMMKESIGLLSASWNDAIRYLRYSCTGFSRNQLQLGQTQGRMIATCHVLEKGLSMPECRPRFGVAMVRSLHQLMREYEAKNGSCRDRHFQSSLEVLEGYDQKHQELSVAVDDVLTPPVREDMARWRAGCAVEHLGVLHFTRQSFFAKSEASFPEFNASRHSCRHFAPSVPVENAQIEEVVRMALRSPSACNRQPARVYAVTDKSSVERCMELHNGSRGFQHLIPGLLIVAARMDVFTGPGERFESYIDGGLFSMSLMHALHHQQLGCVPLNWSVTPAQDRRLKALVGIPDSENIIMLLAIGHPAETFSIPQSARRELGEVLDFPSMNSSSQT